MQQLLGTFLIALFCASGDMALPVWLSFGQTYLWNITQIVCNYGKYLQAFPSLNENTYLEIEKQFAEKWNVDSTDGKHIYHLCLYSHTMWISSTVVKLKMNVSDIHRTKLFN